MKDSRTDPLPGGVWARLRRRKVVQWGLAYTAGAWGLLQGVDFLVDAFHWPDAIKQYATLATVVGLAIALVLAWFHGERGQQRPTAIEIVTLATLLAAGGGLLWLYERPLEPVSGRSADRATGDGLAQPVHRALSIAVLPFENRSRLEDDAFFVDGIHDDILTQLSKVGALRVISRTSVEQFRETTLPTSAIARMLDVATILEGGVQRAGNRVRINVQLIDAQRDAHLWAQTYDRELTAANIFAIQTEVATAIAAALRTTLTTGERTRVEAASTQKLEAWEAYQLGRQRLARRTSESLAEAERYFRTAIEIDPEFAVAYVGVADTLVLRLGHTGYPPASTLDRAEEAVGEALDLQPSLAEAVAAAASISLLKGDYASGSSTMPSSVTGRRSRSTPLCRIPTC